MNCVLGSGRITNPARSSSRNADRKLPPISCGHVLVGHAADQELRQPIPRQLGQPRPDLVAEARADQIVGDLAVQHPVTGLGHGHHVGEQILKLEHLHAAVGHLGDEVEVVAAGLLQPDDVVEQQLLAGLRRQPLVRESGRAHQDSPQPTRLRPHAQPGFRRVHRCALRIRHRTDRLPVAINTTATTEVSATTATTARSGIVKAGRRLSRRAQR